VKLILLISLEEVRTTLNKNFLVYLAGNIVFGFTQWLVIVLIIKLGTKLELGAYTYGIAVIAPILLLMSFGYNTLIVTKPELQKHMLYITRWNNMLITLVIYSLLIYYFSTIESDLYKLMIVIALSKLADSLMEIDYSYYIKANLHWKVGLYKIVFSAFQLILIVIGYYMFANLFIALFIYSIVVIIFATYKNRKYLTIRKFKWHQLFLLIKFGIPLSIALFLSSLNTNIPKYVLENEKSLIDVGVFSSLIIIYSAGNIFYFSLYNFLLPRVVNQKDNKRYLQRLLFIILGGNGVLVLSLLIFLPFIAEQLIQILFNKHFLSFKKDFLIIIYSSFAVYSSILLDLFINAFQKYIYNTATQIISVLVVLVGSVKLIPIYSVFGATLAFVLFAITVFSLKLLLSIYIIRGVSHGD
jgi:O-antigen/teichoic acid export membrane protein